MTISPPALEVIVLLSGGLDSAAVLHLYRDRCAGAMFVDYGQAAASMERLAARALCKYYGVPLQERCLLGAASRSTGEIPGRNGFLICLAAMDRPVTAWAIAVGIHAGTTYLDCSGSFLDAMKLAIKFQANPPVLLAPFSEWTKADVLAFCESEGIPTHLTYSCQQGGATPCGECTSCCDRKAFDARASIKAHT